MTEPSPARDDGARPSITVIAQYIKDLSFECPRFLGRTTITNRTSDFSVAVDIGIAAIEPDRFEVTVTLRADARFSDDASLALTLVYAGIFVFKDLPSRLLAPTLNVVAPELLFPFMRKTVNRLLGAAGLTEFLDRFDFADLYQKKGG